MTVSSKNEYDSEGNLIELKIYNAQGELSQSNKYEYATDENGNRVESEKIFDSQGNQVMGSEVTLDAAGNRIELKSYGPGGVPAETFKYTYQYDETGNRIESGEILDSEGNPCGSVETVFDDQGNQISSIRYDSEGNVVYQYPAANEVFAASAEDVTEEDTEEPAEETTEEVTEETTEEVAEEPTEDITEEVTAEDTEETTEETTEEVAEETTEEVTEETTEEVAEETAEETTEEVTEETTEEVTEETTEEAA